MTAKAALISAIAEQNFRSAASLADVHLANAIEALIDERIKGPQPKVNSDLAEQLKRMREEINQGTG